MISNFALQALFSSRPRRIEKFGSEKQNSRTRVSFDGFIVGLRDDEARSECRRAILVRIKLQRAAHRLTVVAEASLAPRLDEELQLVLSVSERLDDVLAGDEIADQHRLLVHETKARGPGLINLRGNRLVTDSANLHSRRHDHGDFRSRAVGGIVVKRKPARRVHQIRSFRPDVGQPLVRERAALRRS